MADTTWETAQRLESLAGEVRVNLIRMAALVAFYGHHLLNAFVLQPDDSLRGDYHNLITIVVLAVLVVHFAVVKRWLVPELKIAAVRLPSPSIGSST